MQFGRRNSFGTPRPNQGFQPPAAPGQAGMGYYNQAGSGYPGFAPMQGGQGGFPPVSRPNRTRNIRLRGTGGGMPSVNRGFGATPPSIGGPGYPASGYPAQGFSMQPLQQPMSPVQSLPTQSFPSQSFPSQSFPSQSFPSQSFPAQNFPSQSVPPQSFAPQGPSPQGFNQGYGQMPLQPAWEQPKKGGIKGFIGGILAKVKR